jgi:hypothetical protein
MSAMFLLCNEFASVSDFVKLGRQFEDVGVSAYLGAADLSIAVPL